LSNYFNLVFRQASVPSYFSHLTHLSSTIISCPSRLISMASNS